MLCGFINDVIYKKGTPSRMIEYLVGKQTPSSNWVTQWELSIDYE